jgi:hypothetical protein
VTGDFTVEFRFSFFTEIGRSRRSSVGVAMD